MPLRFGFSMNFMTNTKINEKIRKIFEAYQSLLIKMIRYFFVALLIVAIEIIAFIFFNSVIKLNYVLAVVLSFVIATILNWFLSRKFVFRPQEKQIKKEIILVFVGSSIGCLLQVVITVISVEQLKMAPVYGKIISMTITFFWNFWFRLKFVFK